jgi:hypothetical protein
MPAVTIAWCRSRAKDAASVRVRRATQPCRRRSPRLPAYASRRHRRPAYSEVGHSPRYLSAGASLLTRVVRRDRRHHRADPRRLQVAEASLQNARFPDADRGAARVVSSSATRSSLAHYNDPSPILKGQIRRDARGLRGCGVARGHNRSGAGAAAGVEAAACFRFPASRFRLCNDGQDNARSALSRRATRPLAARARHGSLARRQQPSQQWQ